MAHCSIVDGHGHPSLEGIPYSNNLPEEGNIERLVRPCQWYIVETGNLFQIQSSRVQRLQPTVTITHSKFGDHDFGIKYDIQRQDAYQYQYPILPSPLQPLH
jgi:hypothetical protein